MAFMVETRSTVRVLSDDEVKEDTQSLHEDTGGDPAGLGYQGVED